MNAGLTCNKTVIATGGSAIYGAEAMEHLRSIGTVVYLRLTLSQIEERLGDLTERGVTLREGQDLKALYEERTPLYEKYAHVIIDCDGQKVRELVTRIEREIGGAQ